MCIFVFKISFLDARVSPDSRAYSAPERLYWGVGDPPFTRRAFFSGALMALRADTVSRMQMRGKLNTGRVANAEIGVPRAEYSDK